MNVLQALSKSANFVEKITNQSKIESKIEAEHIFMFVLEINKTKLYEQYQISLSDSNKKKIDDILELRTFNQENGLILHPNPTNHYLSLTFIEETAGTYDLLIADKSGKVWESQRDIAATTIVKLNLLDLPVGAYHVFVKQGKNKFSQQFVKR